MEHKSVMLNECIEALNIRSDGIYCDFTLGRAGHSKAILEKLTSGHLYAFDLDQQAIEESEAVLKDYKGRYTLIHDNFANAKARLAELGVEKVDGILMDLGVSSPQFDDPKRGFSYRFDTRLDMRMDESQTLDAYQIVNTYSEAQLAEIIFRYGEERFSRSIARNIVKTRAKAPIETTGQLNEIIRQSMPAKVVAKQGHPSKKTYMALRIATNQELDNLQKALDEGSSLLAAKGRMVILTFHSLEDRLVKQAFAQLSADEQLDKRIPIKASELKSAQFRLVNHKPITSMQEELDENHRAHSAKLRILERKGE